MFWWVFRGCGVEKWRLKLTSAKVVVEVEAELGNQYLLNDLSITILWYDMLSNIRYLVSYFAIS